MSNVKRQAQYSAKEKKAYYLGKGAGIGKGKGIKLFVGTLSSAEKESFYNGFDSVFLKQKK